MKLQVNPSLKMIVTYNGTYLSMKGLHQGINATAEQIINYCDGSNTINDILRKFEIDYQLDSNDKMTIVDFIKELIEKNIIITGNNFVSKKVTKFGDKELVLPNKFSIELTNNCQLRCKHCFNNSGLKKNELDFSTIFDICKQLVNMSIPDFFLTGGEATLYDGIDIILDYLAQNSRSVVLATNGFHLSERLINVIKSHQNIAVQVSLDGIEDNHDFLRGKGSFSAAIRTICLLTKLRAPVIIAFTLNNLNLDDLEPAILLAKQLGCIDFRIGVTLPMGRALENLNLVPKNYPKTHEVKVNEMFQKYNTNQFKVGIDICEDRINEQESINPYFNKCGAGFMFAHLESNGNVIPCPSLPEYSLGNVKDYSMTDIFHINNIEKTYNLITPTLDTCGHCESYDKCKHCISNGLRNSKLVKGCELSERYKKISDQYYINENDANYF